MFEISSYFSSISSSKRIPHKIPVAELVLLYIPWCYDLSVDRKSDYEKGNEYETGVYQLCNNPRRYGNSRATWDQAVRLTYHPAEVIFLPLPQPIKAGIRFSDPAGMQGWVFLAGLVTHRGGVPAWRRSSILVLTGLNVEQLRSYDQWCYYHYAKTPRILNFHIPHIGPLTRRIVSASVCPLVRGSRHDRPSCVGPRCRLAFLGIYCIACRR